MCDTIDRINKHLKSERYLGCVEPIMCKSGLTLSVQASDFHMCIPKNNHGPWTSVEVGYPSKRVAALLPFRERTRHREKVSPIYPYVPMRVLAAIVDKNGGFASERASRYSIEMPFPDDCAPYKIISTNPASAKRTIVSGAMTREDAERELRKFQAKESKP